MKTKKIVALVLSMAMVLGVVAACKTTETSGSDSSAATSASADSSATEDSTTQQAADLEGFTAVALAENVTDKEDGDLLVWGWNEDPLEKLIGNAEKGLTGYYSGTNMTKDNYATTPSQGGAYRNALKIALSAGEGAPDIYFAEADYIKAFMTSSGAKAVNELGIDYSELKDMYNYVLQTGADSNGVIRALSWECNPAGVWYNRKLAQQYLGASEPADVAKFFESWDAFLDTARKINKDSQGKVKAVASIADVQTPYFNSRSTGWVVNGALNIDQKVNDYLEFGKILKQEGLTFDVAQWGEDGTWAAGSTNDTVLSYFGPTWLGVFSLNLRGENNEAINDNVWGICAAPNNYFWGGTWIVASPYCDRDATAAQMMRDLCTNTKNLENNASNANFVNNIPVMEAAAANKDFSFGFLGGQNPFEVLNPMAKEINASIMSAYDGQIKDEFNTIAEDYFEGKISSTDEVATQLEAAVEDILG